LTPQAITSRQLTLPTHLPADSEAPKLAEIIIEILPIGILGVCGGSLCEKISPLEKVGEAFLNRF